MKLSPFSSLSLLLLLVPCAFAADTVQRIYTAPDPAAAGGIRGSVNAVVTHALALNHDRLRVYRADLSDGGKTFVFSHLPTGKYDLVLVGKEPVVFEGLNLGEEKPAAELPPGSLDHLKARVAAQDAFFNHCLIQRVGFDGANALVFVERTTDRQTLRQDGTRLNATIRRLEVMEIAQAADDWQVTTTRHLYREEQPPGGINFLKHAHVPEMGNLRVIDSVKNSVPFCSPTFESMAHIRILTAPDQDRLLPLTGQGLTIGRDPACDLVLDTTSPASRRHASIYPAAQGGGWRIRDLGSSNGTALNGGWIEDSPLVPGDQVSVAALTFVYEDQGNGRATAPMEAAASAATARVDAPAAAAFSANDERIEAVVRSMSEMTRLIKEEIGKVIIGQGEIVSQLLTAIISNGHVLMIGMPGLAKTLLIRTVSEVMELDFRRVQFTPDLMPSDITGTDILEVDEATGKKEYRFIRGPIFTNILLADEINRTPPKTQAALLEAMQEHRVTAAGQTMTLTPPFFVLATQNPLEQEGTYPLPEAQLDRFMFSIYVDYPSEEDEATIAKVTTRQEKIRLRKILGGPEILELQNAVRTLPISDHVVLFATRLVRATRPGDPGAPDFIKKWIHAGAGVRASQYLVVAAKARAVTAGRLVVTCDDVRASARPILRHRMFTNFTADSEGMDTDKIVQKLIETIPEPGEKDYATRK